MAASYRLKSGTARFRQLVRYRLTDSSEWAVWSPLKIVPGFGGVVKLSLGAAISYKNSNLGEAGCSQRNVFAVNDLRLGMKERNSGLAASFPTLFFGFVDSKGHSRFVLRISILVSHSATPTKAAKHGADGLSVPFEI